MYSCFFWPDATLYGEGKNLRRATVCFSIEQVRPRDANVKTSLLGVTQETFSRDFKDPRTGQQRERQNKKVY